MMPDYLNFGRCSGVDQFFLKISLLNTHTHTFDGPLSGTTQVSGYQKGKTNVDFTEARDSVWQWHQLGHMQVCTLLQTDNHASTPPLSFLQAGCPSCCQTNSIKALKARVVKYSLLNTQANFLHSFVRLPAFIKWVPSFSTLPFETWELQLL